MLIPDADTIALHGLALSARAGVPDAERAIPQRLLADIVLWPSAPLTDLQDDLTRTVDYGHAARICREAAGRGEYQLIETLADTLCGELLSRFPLQKVRVTVNKVILPDTRAVSVTLTRTAPPSAVPASSP